MSVCTMLSGLFKSRQSVSVGGPIGSKAEAQSNALSNPNYDAAYLAHRLGARNPNPERPFDEAVRDRYNNRVVKSLPAPERMVYLMNATKDHESEAEECLKSEFKLWLAGQHPDNKAPRKYTNTEGGLKRRDPRGLPNNNWHPTWWGNRQLTHLPGVREYLREEAINEDKNSFDMNMLADYGPSNLEEAWAYFKYWVKARPVGPGKCMIEKSAVNDDFQRSGPVSMAPYRSEAIYLRDKALPLIDSILEAESIDEALNIKPTSTLRSNFVGRRRALAMKLAKNKARLQAAEADEQRVKIKIEEVDSKDTSSETLRQAEVLQRELAQVKLEVERAKAEEAALLYDSPRRAELVDSMAAAMDEEAPSTMEDVPLDAVSKGEARYGVQVEPFYEGRGQQALSKARADYEEAKVAEEDYVAGLQAAQIAAMKREEAEAEAEDEAEDEAEEAEEEAEEEVKIEQPPTEPQQPSRLQRLRAGIGNLGSGIRDGIRDGTRAYWDSVIDFHVPDVSQHNVPEWDPRDYPSIDPNKPIKPLPQYTGSLADYEPRPLRATVQGIGNAASAVGNAASAVSQRLPSGRIMEYVESAAPNIEPYEPPEDPRKAAIMQEAQRQIDLEDNRKAIRDAKDQIRAENAAVVAKNAKEEADEIALRQARMAMVKDLAKGLTLTPLRGAMSLAQRGASSAADRAQSVATQEEQRGAKMSDAAEFAYNKIMEFIESAAPVVYDPQADANDPAAVAGAQAGAIVGAQDADDLQEAVRRGAIAGALAGRQLNNERAGALAGAEAAAAAALGLAPDEAPTDPRPRRPARGAGRGAGDDGGAGIGAEFPRGRGARRRLMVEDARQERQMQAVIRNAVDNTPRTNRDARAANRNIRRAQAAAQADQPPYVPYSPPAQYRY